jgi:hypothetical protein
MKEDIGTVRLNVSIHANSCGEWLSRVLAKFHGGVGGGGRENVYSWVYSSCKTAVRIWAEINKVSE